MGLTDRVKFYPNAPAEQKVDLLKKAKLYLHTMEGEHFGISIVEAMALGCLPIVHDSGGMREFVPAQYRYTSIEQAAKKVSTEINGWTFNKAQEMNEIASQFSIQKFSEHFMEYFKAYYANA
jgi:glycosyltransferase involved in cell wall biosynthesis